MQPNPKKQNWQEKLYEIIYEADTKAGKLFDVILLWLILGSIALVMLESVKTYDAKYHNLFNLLEWIITLLFSLEYIARIISAKKVKKYIFSFYGIIDFLSTIPKYVSILFGGAHALIALRALRLLRVFRVLKLARFVGATKNLSQALKASRYRISVFISAVIVICIIIGTVMYLIEGDQSGFTSIPKSIYWAIVTLTTVGYGDIAPQTAFGQFIASLVMILGYGIIAIPTGIVTAEFTKQSFLPDQNLSKPSCPNCAAEQPIVHAQFCYNCGKRLNKKTNKT